MIWFAANEKERERELVNFFSFNPFRQPPLKATTPCVCLLSNQWQTVLLAGAGAEVTFGRAAFWTEIGQLKGGASLLRPVGGAHYLIELTNRAYGNSINILSSTNVKPVESMQRRSGTGKGALQANATAESGSRWRKLELHWKESLIGPLEAGWLAGKWLAGSGGGH